MVLWVLDFAAYLLRLIYSAGKEGEALPQDGHPWIFLLHRSAHKAFAELLHLSQRFLSDLDTYKNNNTYLKSLKDIIVKERVNLSSYVTFWSNLGQQLAMFARSTNSIDKIESQLFLFGTIDNAYAPFLVYLRSAVFDNLATFYDKQEAIELFKKIEGKDNRPSTEDIFLRLSMSQSIRFVSNNGIDILLQQNIRSRRDLKTCSRCRKQTQIAIDIDSQFKEYQAVPCWLNTYISNCYCGGFWVS
jgi:hypothetical protein